MSNDNYCTPKWLVEIIDEVIDGIDLDPCGNELSHVNAKITYTEQNPFNDEAKANLQKGLSVFINPPYSRGNIIKFAEWLDDYRYGYDENRAAIVITNGCTDTKWFHKLLEHSDAICLLKKRVRFEMDGVTMTRNTMGQVIFFYDDYIGSRFDYFENRFKYHGAILERDMRLL